MFFYRHARHFTVPVDQAAVPQARRLARAALSDWGSALGDQLVDTIMLIVTELVTNSVLHAGDRTSCVDVTLRLRDGRLTVEVRDDHPSRPSLNGAAAGDEHGRGLYIVHHLAGERGGCVRVQTCAERPGKVVVVELETGTMMYAWRGALAEPVAVAS
ncbi:ATP-binding protein [Streptomyces sp. NPDC048409]|uniref:ATP-binding protein n=1 Tax=Streptomyces sp. NPDC048409 TaxID=3154723 RepID=UPI003420A5E8